MPKINYDKLPYKNPHQSPSVPSEDSHGFYSPIPGPTPEYYRGYHTYDFLVLQLDVIKKKKKMIKIMKMTYIYNIK